MKSKLIFFACFVLFLTAIIIVQSVNADTITPVTTPYISIDPIGNHTTGDSFFINGTTNLAAINESLELTIFNPNPGGYGSSYTSNVSVQPGENGVNLWSEYISASRWTTSTRSGTSISDYNMPGQYTVLVHSPDTIATIFFSMLPSESRILTSYTPPVASFIITNSSGTAPLAVQFTDTSANSPTSWLWSFGDGRTSRSQNPSHIYTNAGTYTVMLTVTNGAGSNTTPGSGIITASGISATTTTVSPDRTPMTTQSSPLSVLVSIAAFVGVVIVNECLIKKRGL